jgi:phage FluMu gp28-like protein
LIATPKIPLTDSQRSFVEDDSQFRWWVAARQTGKSHGLAADSIVPCVERPRNLEILLSAGERQTVELIQKVRQQCQALGVASELLEGFFRDTSLLQHTVTFPNKSRVIGLPANPDTARGYSGNVKLDEAGLFKNSREIWAALAPSATRGFRIAMVSTFKGTANKFYEIGKDLGLHTGERPGAQPVRVGVWSGHWTDVHMSAEQALRTLGVRIDVERLREAIGDDEVWAQEFLNIPMSGADSFISLEMLLGCESGEASIDWDGQARPGLCAGYDVARKRDGSVIFIGYPVGPLLVICGVKILSQMSFADQRKICREVAVVVEASGGRFAMDATGLGMQLGEELHAEFPCVEPVNFATSVDSTLLDKDGKPIKVGVKERMAGILKRRAEERMIWLPESVQLRREFQAIKRYVGPTGAVRLDAERTDKGGHADWFWACALLCGAMEGARNYVPASECGLVGNAVMSGLMERQF